MGLCLSPLSPTLIVDDRNTTRPSLLTLGKAWLYFSQLPIYKNKKNLGYHIQTPYKIWWSWGLKCCQFEIRLFTWRKTHISQRFSNIRFPQAAALALGKVYTEKALKFFTRSVETKMHFRGLWGRKMSFSAPDSAYIGIASLTHFSVRSEPLIDLWGIWRFRRHRLTNPSRCWYQKSCRHCLQNNKLSSKLHLISGLVKSWLGVRWKKLGRKYLKIISFFTIERQLDKWRHYPCGYTHVLPRCKGGFSKEENRKTTKNGFL